MSTCRFWLNRRINGKKVEVMKCQYCGSHNCSWIMAVGREDKKLYKCNGCGLINVWKHKAIPVKT